MNESNAYMIIFILSFLFLILPIFTNFYQLHKSIQVWISDIETGRVVQPWIQRHLRPLYLMTILLGSAFSAVDLANSNIFDLAVCNMSLNTRQKAIFKNQRLFSIVILENIPQC